jgi:hypothetical protein
MSKMGKGKMAFKSIVGATCACILVFGISNTVGAATVSFDFTATVTNVNTFSLTSSGGLIGQSGTGHITYDLNPDYVNSFPAAGSSTYGFDIPDAEFTFQLSGMNFIAGSLPNTPSSAARADLAIDMRNDSTSGDMQAYWGNAVSQTLEEFSTRMALVFRDTTNTALSNDLLPTEAPIMTLFEAANSNLQIQISTAPGTHTAGLTLSIDSVTATIVPVPAAIWLFGSGLLGLIGLARRKV